MRAHALGLLASVLLVSSPVRAQGGWPTWNGDAVQDAAGILTATQEDSLRTLLAPARGRGVDVRVVTIRSMSDYPVQAAGIEEFAHGLFDAWRVGDRPERDGVLLLVATEDRQLRIQLGDGLPADLDGEARRVVADSIVPWFRQGMRPRGILRGTAAIAEWFTPEWAARQAAAPVAVQPAYTPPPRAPQSPGGMGGAGGVVLLVLGVGGLVAGVAWLQSYLRNRPRDCEQCGARMARLDEASDDVYLDSGQKMEELLRSVDYDVWKCGTCGSHRLLPYQAFFSGKSPCPSCRYRTVTTTTTVLEHATYDHGGREEVTSHCRNCSLHQSRIVHTPRRTRPSDNDDSSSWSSGSSSRSFSSSSSSSSSSSGGGFSSGRGASGSW